MKLFAETMSHNPWTKGEINSGRRIAESEPSRSDTETSSFRTISPSLNSVDFGVSVDNDRFPNFKEEINV
jgi:hypothetical protein